MPPYGEGLSCQSPLFLLYYIGWKGCPSLVVSLQYPPNVSNPNMVMADAPFLSLRFAISLMWF